MNGYLGFTGQPPPPRLRSAVGDVSIDAIAVLRNAKVRAEIRSAFFMVIIPLKLINKNASLAASSNADNNFPD